ncbi:unnamed protein product, partial [Discosporangium mesarthrocarpum]
MEAAIHNVFLDFCSFGAGQAGSAEMDSAKFVKLANDCKLVNKNLTTTDLDIIFTRVKPKGARKIGVDTFLEALSEIAAHKGVSFEDVASTIVAAGGPIAAGVASAESVRFHDDKSTFTGVHNHGGPSHVDRANVDMSRQLDRSGADIRGVKEYQGGPRGGGSGAAASTVAGKGAPRSEVYGGNDEVSWATRVRQHGARRASRGSSSSPHQQYPRRTSGGTGMGGGGASAGEGVGVGGEVEERVQEVFVAFASSVAKESDEMDGARFFKLFRDCGMVGRSLSRTDCDLIFAKVCSKTGCLKKIHYNAFRK